MRTTTLRRWARALAAIAVVVVVRSSAGAGDPLAFPPVALPEPREQRRPVGHAEWAARLVEGLGLEHALPEDHDADEVFGLLCPDALRTGAGGRPLPARRPLRVRVDDLRLAPAAEPQRLRVAVPGSALYALVVHGHGEQRWRVDGREVGVLDPSSLRLDWAPRLLPLARGAHELTVELTGDGRVERVELVAFRTLCVAPAGGWSSTRPLSFGAKARTMVQVLGLEHRLPEDGTPWLREGETFDESEGAAGHTNRRFRRRASQGAWALAREGPVTLAWRVVLERPGVYSLAARVHGTSRQVWEVDGRYGVALRPREEAASFAWEPVATLALAAGEHVLRARLAPGAGVDAIRLVRRRADDAAYLDVLGELGLREGPPDALVSAADADANLTSQVFRTRVAGFLQRFGDPPDQGITHAEQELRTLYERPLSPVIPAEL